MIYGLLTFGARAGYDTIEFDDPLGSLDPDEDGAFGLAYLIAYPLEDLSVLGGVEYRFDNVAFRVETEYAVSGCGLSIFAQGLFGTFSQQLSCERKRYYFGSDKNIQERHREDDPRNVIKDVLTGIFTYTSEYEREFMALE